MKNLHVIQTDKVKLAATIVGHCIDADNKRFIVLTEDLKVFEVRDNLNTSLNQIEHLFQTELIGISQIRQEDVILVEYIVESGSVCVILKSGHFIRLGVSSFSPSSECVYAHDKPISSVKFSPDQDLIALADANNDIFIFTADYSMIYSSNTLTNNNSAHKPVGVGWGSKETQFFGLDGRPSKEKESKDKIILAEDELAAIEKIESSDIFKRFRRRKEKCTLVDWRGDGQLLATFTHIPDTDKHYLKVWNRNLELQYMSEQLVTMERGLLSWVPNGQYVCTAQRRDHRINEITMFEKNGMVHQRLTLPTFIPHLYITDMLWSPDSKILSIIVVQFVNSGAQIDQKQMIMLYTMQNFHYYLKYSAHLTFGGDHYSMRWDPIYNNILYISSDNGSCSEYNCTIVVDHCQEDTTVAVIDANKIHLTPFSICNIPPPMSAITIELDSLVNRLVLHPKCIGKMFVISAQNKMIYLSSCDQAIECPKSDIKSNIENDSVKSFRCKLGQFQQVNFELSDEYQNFTLIGENSLIATRRSGNSSEFVKIELVDDQDGPRLKTSVVKVIEKGEVVAIVKESFNDRTNTISLIMDDSSCVQLDLANGDISPKFSLKSTADRLYIKETQFVARFGVVLTLTLDLTLRVDENVVASNSCTSFRTTENFLIYTTTDNTIHFIPLDKIASKEDQDEVGSWNQPIETGGTLILASERDSKIILQMPRGNLEILHPRIMVLLRVTIHLDQSEYLSAMKLARRYRVDLNFLADYMLRCDKKTFYSSKLNTFANDIAQCDPSLLNLFITELSQDDTTRRRYASAMKFLPVGNRLLDDKQESPTEEKVNKICSSIQLAPDPKYLQPKLLCLLKQEPRKSDEALRLIHRMPDKGEREAALKFILYFISIEQLFSDALTTYDTDIAIMVASVSSKDPKEYLTLLDGFNEIANVYLRQYKMDFHVKNYEKAFSNLLAYLPDAPDKETTRSELLNIVVSKRIYKHAIKACFDQFVNFVTLSGEQCRVDPTFQQLGLEIWSKYGDYLLEKRYYLEAGLAYSKSMARSPSDKKIDNVMKCFLLANDWERCVAAIERYQLTDPRRKEALKNISSNLMLQGDYLQSVFVMQLTKNDKLAFELISKERWYLAEFIVTNESRQRLHEEISRSVGQDFDIKLSSLKNDLCTAKEQFERLKTLLLTPPKTDFFDMDNCYTADSLSTVDGSEASSVVSGSKKNQGRTARSGAPSIKTRTSSKSNKSQTDKKRKINLKVGSRHEDIALVMELKKFISKQKSNQESVRNLIATQIDYMDLNSLSERHNCINDVLKDSFELAKNIQTKLWTKSDQEDDNVFSVYKRFGKVLAAGEYVDNLDLEILLRPDLPGTLMLLEF